MRTTNNDIYNEVRLNELVEEAKQFIFTREIDLEIERRLKSTISTNNCLVVFHLNDAALGYEKPALIILEPDYAVDLSTELKPTEVPLNVSPFQLMKSYVLLICSEDGAGKLRNEVSRFLEYRHVEQHLDLSLQNKMDLRYHQEEASHSIDSAFAEAWSVVSRFAGSSTELLFLDKADTESNLSLQLSKKIFPLLAQKNWLG